MAVVIFFLASRFPVVVTVGRTGYSWGWAEAALIGSTALLPLSWIPVAAGLGGLLAHLTRRMQFRNARFNASVATLSAGAAIGVVAGSNLLGANAFAGLAAAGLGYALADALLVAIVMSMDTGERFTDCLADGATVSAVFVMLNTAVAVGLVVMAAWHPLLLLWAPLAGVMLYRMSASSAALSEQDRAWQRLDDTVRELNTLSEADVFERLIAGATGLFRAGRASVDLYATPASPLTVGQTISVGLVGPEGELGTLRLHFESRTSLSRSEKRALHTLSSAAGAALHNARQHAQATYDATHDELTGLANRRALVAAMDEHLAGDGQLALLLIDLDRFKEINDTLGHPAGDTVLREVALRLRDVMRDDVVVARLGGDEFAILVPGVGQIAAAERIAERILQSLAVPGEVDDIVVSVTGSVGIACAPGDATTANDLLRCADVSMYTAKASGGAVARRYCADDDAGSVERLSLEPALRLALTLEDALVVYMQPQVDMLTGEAVGAEALVRWQHSERGLLAPYLWLPLVAQCGLQGALTRYVLRHSLVQRQAWSLHGLHLPVSVNLSPRDLLDSRLPAAVAKLLAQTGTPPEQLVLEIPETMVGSELDVQARVLAELSELGVQLSLDDFGAGGAPISMLTRVPVAELKVDRSFVWDLVPADGGVSQKSRAASAVVAAAVGLGQALGQRVIAEGVETQEQVNRLNALGCTTAQGFLYERPQPAADALQALLLRAERFDRAEIVALGKRIAR